MIKLDQKAFNKGVDDVIFMRHIKDAIREAINKVGFANFKKTSMFLSNEMKRKRKPTRRYRPRPDLIEVDQFYGIPEELQRILRGGE